MPTITRYLTGAVIATAVVLTGCGIPTVEQSATATMQSPNRPDDRDDHQACRDAQGDGTVRGGHSDRAAGGRSS